MRRESGGVRTGGRKASGGYGRKKRTVRKSEEKPAREVTEELRRGISGDRCSASERESNAIKRLRCLVRGELPLEDIRGKIEKRRGRKRERETRGVSRHWGILGKNRKTKKERKREVTERMNKGSAKSVSHEALEMKKITEWGQMYDQTDRVASRKTEIISAAIF